MLDFFVLGLAAFFAGMVDAVVGGGGLIQLPALFSVYPTTAPASLLGTSKLAGVWGTGAAAFTYVRKVRVEWNAALPAAISAFLFAFLGAYTVTQLPPDFLRALLPVLLLIVAIYTFAKKDFGATHAPIYKGNFERFFAIVLGGAIGFYDGFFGPGTGSFLLFFFIRFFGFDFLGASAAAKIVNVACNLAALWWFGISGHVLIQLGLLMAVCNISGSLIGSSLALRYGSSWIRKVFLFVLLLLICKTSLDAMAL
ncbi:MAG: sulfite exporter TauE/SafE family protein [Burkholderiaceae bacterium]